MTVALTLQDTMPAVAAPTSNVVARLVGTGKVYGNGGTAVTVASQRRTGHSGSGPLRPGGGRESHDRDGAARNGPDDRRGRALGRGTAGR